MVEQKNEAGADGGGCADATEKRDKSDVRPTIDGLMSLVANVFNAGISAGHSLGGTVAMRQGDEAQDEVRAYAKALVDHDSAETELLVAKFGEAAYRVGTTFAEGVNSSDDRKYQVNVAHKKAKAALLANLAVQPNPFATDEPEGLS